MSDGIPELTQRIYERLLKDNNFKCTCSESFREDSFYQAQGHYANCILNQCCRAVNISIDEARRDAIKEVDIIFNRLTTAKFMEWIRKELSQKDD
jgi:hypothetical protein